MVGGPGSGKSTTASRVAALLAVPRVELDALWWQPGWTRRPSRRSGPPSPISLTDAWVIDGNYLCEVGRDIVWPKTETLVWLDVPRHVAVARTLRRAVRRVTARTVLWGTNRQSAAALTPVSIARLVQRWPTYSLSIEATVRNGQSPHLGVVRLRSRSEVTTAEAGVVRVRSGGRASQQRRLRRRR